MRPAADAAAADRTGARGRNMRKKGLPVVALCTHVSERTFELVFVEQAAAGTEQAKQAEFTLSSRFW